MPLVSSPLLHTAFLSLELGILDCSHEWKRASMLHCLDMASITFERSFFPLFLLDFKLSGLFETRTTFKVCYDTVKATLPKYSSSSSSLMSKK